MLLGTSLDEALLIVGRGLEHRRRARLRMKATPSEHQLWRILSDRELRSPDASDILLDEQVEGVGEKSPPSDAS